jgi:hypothetical protein
MKDINDAQTIDWVDSVELTDNERKFLEDGMYRHALFDAMENLPHSVALNNLTDRTITDILNNQQEQ